MSDPFVLRSRRVELPLGQRSADILIESGKVASVDEYGAITDGYIIEDVGDQIILPGLVDTHVHLNEPGRTEWEGFQTGTNSAKAGGVTTLVDMPLNSSPVTTTVGSLSLKRRSAAEKLHVDVGFHAGLVPGNATSIASVIEAGALAAKVFLCPSGIDEFEHCGENELRQAMPILADLGVPLLVHAEIVYPVPPLPNPLRYRDYLESRPAAFERDAIKMMIRLARETGCRVHIVHLADADCVSMIAEARDEGLPLTVETCPHYLCFDAESIQDGRTDFKCAPPIRDRANRERLWDALSNGIIDMIVSDHSPSTPELKQLDSGRFDLAWGGISSLQIGLPAIWTEAHQRGFELGDVVRWMSTKPAELLGLSQGIQPGNPAHLVAFDPTESWVVNQNELLHRNPITPYHERTFRGMVKRTWVHGETGEQPRGRTL